MHLTGLIISKSYFLLIMKKILVAKNSSSIFVEVSDLFSLQNPNDTELPNFAILFLLVQ